MSIRRNTLVNLAGHLAPLAVTLLTVPPYLGLIGEARYGVLTICWMLLGYFGLFDLGLGQATAQRMATLRDVSAQERGRLLSTALLINTCLGLLAGAVFWLAGRLLLTRLVPHGGTLLTEAVAALPWFALCLPISILSSALAGSLQGLERFGAVNRAQVCGTFLGQVLPLTVAWLGGTELDRLIPATLLARLTSTLMLLRQCRHHVPLARCPSPDPTLIRPLFSFGGWLAITAILTQLLHGTDRIVIGAIAGVRAVTYYSVPFGLISRAMILPGSMSSALFPRFASVREGRRLDLQTEAIRAMRVVMAPLIVVGLFLMEPFLAAWIDAEFAQRSTRIGEIMLVGLWAIAVAHIPYALTVARGRPDLVAKLHLAELLPYFAMLYGGLLFWGANGAAAAWTARGIIATVILFVLAGTARVTFRLVIFPTVLILGAAAATFCLPYRDPSRWLCAGALTVASAIWAWQTSPPSIRNLVPVVMRRSGRIDAKTVITR